MPKHQFVIGQSRMVRETTGDEFGPLSVEYRYPDEHGVWNEDEERKLRESGFVLEWQPTVSMHWDRDMGIQPVSEETSGYARLWTEVGADEILRAAAFIRRERAAGHTVPSFSFETARLKRRDFNEGISAMRRARDAVFGPDA